MLMSSRSAVSRHICSQPIRRRRSSSSRITPERGQAGGGHRCPCLTQAPARPALVFDAVDPALSNLSSAPDRSLLESARSMPWNAIPTASSLLNSKTLCWASQMGTGFQTCRLAWIWTGAPMSHTPLNNRASCWRRPRNSPKIGVPEDREWGGLLPQELSDWPGWLCFSHSISKGRA